MITLTDSHTYNAVQVRPITKQITRGIERVISAIIAATSAFDEASGPSLEVGNINVSVSIIGFPIYQ